MSQPEDAFIQIERVSTRFDGPAVVDDLSLEIGRGEMFAILGGSGCGKTTLLRILAGFEIPNSGRVLIDGIDVTHIPPYERPVNMMFQSYAVFPHMTVDRNIAYGLIKEGRSKGEIKTRVAEMLELVRLTGFEKRKPDQLSGGQMQRVALARALVKNPKVLLLDEPLAALDKQLREQMQFELMNIQDKLGITCVVVTHDQEEAMSLASRIAVMNEGRLLQIGHPSQVYESPQDLFVASFFGTINSFKGVVVEVNGDGALVDTPALGLLRTRADDQIQVSQSVHVAIRPEKISIGPTPPNGDQENTVQCKVWDLGYYGNHSTYRVRTESDVQIQVSTLNHERSGRHRLEWEDEAYVWWARESSIVLKD